MFNMNETTRTIAAVLIGAVLGPVLASWVWHHDPKAYLQFDIGALTGMFATLVYFSDYFKSRGEHNAEPASTGSPPEAACPAQKELKTEQPSAIHCPDCGGTEFLEGPSAGCMVNIRCANSSCNSEFSTLAVPGARELQRISPQ